jgi:hypothetical protein
MDSFDIIIRAADALDSIGKRDLANELDAIVKKAAKVKPHYKVGDRVLLKEETGLPVTNVKIDPHFGPQYLLSLWVLERDLREPVKEAVNPPLDNPPTSNKEV